MQKNGYTFATVLFCIRLYQIHSSNWSRNFYSAKLKYRYHGNPGCRVFQGRDTKSERFLPIKSIYSKVINYTLNFENCCSGKLSKIGHH